MANFLHNKPSACPMSPGRSLQTPEETDCRSVGQSNRVQPLCCQPRVQDAVSRPVAILIIIIGYSLCRFRHRELFIAEVYQYNRYPRTSQCFIATLSWELPRIARTLAVFSLSRSRNEVTRKRPVSSFLPKALLIHIITSIFVTAKTDILKRTVTH